MKRAKVVLVLIGITLVFALATGLPLLYRFLYVLALGLASSFVWTWLNLLGLSAEVLRKASRTQVGGPVEERLTVRNTGWLPKVWLEVVDRTNLPGHHTGTVISLSRGSFRSWKVLTECRKRGHFTLGPISVTSGDPFGLFSMERSFGPLQNILVYPATVELARFALLPGDLPGDTSYHRRSQHITPNAFTTRDYMFGDSFNRIHWRSTARFGKLMVKEFEEEPSSDLWILLDMERPVHAGQEEESTEEYAVTVAASVAKLYLEANQSVGLIAYGDKPYRLEPLRGDKQLTDIMETLAVVTARGDTPLFEVLVEEAKHFGRHTSVLVITPSANPEWTAGLRHLLQRKVRSAAVLLDAATFGGARSIQPLAAQLAGIGIPSYVIRRGDNLGAALSQAETAAPAMLAMRGR